MRKLSYRSRGTKKLFLAVVLIAISSVVSIISNYKDMGVLKILHRKLPIYSVSTEDKKVAVTFDISLGDEENTEKILDILDKYQAKATFFLVGRWIDDNEKYAKEIVERGHELGNHSDKHPDMTQMSKGKITADIMSCEAKIIAATGHGTKLFRSPEGAYNDTIIEAAEEAGFFNVQWDVDSIDWKEEGASIEYNRVIKKTKPGSILLFHNTAKYTPETLPRVLETLQKDGYTFVKVSDLIYKDNYYIDASGKQIPK